MVTATQYLLNIKMKEACRKDACLEVGVNPRGAQQILSLFDNEAITLHYQTKN